MLTNWLKKPYPFIDSFVLKLALSVGLSLVAFLFLYFFRPFRLHIVESDLYMAGFGMCSLLSIAIHLILLPILFPKIFDNDKWTVFKQIIFISSMTFFIGLFNYYYNSRIGIDISPQYSFTTMVIMSVSVGILPIIILTYIIEKYEAQKNQQLAFEIKIPAVEKIKDTLSITSNTNQNEKLNILSSALIYIESAKNYCLIYYLFQGEVKKEMMRITMKEVVEQLKEKSQFIRCHRSFIVNKEHIDKLEGNARSLLVKMKHIEDTIPVSRSFDKSLIS